MLRHACISFALLVALGTAAYAQVSKPDVPKNTAAGYGGCKDSVRARDPDRQPVRDYQRLLDCTKRALAEAKARLEQLSAVKLDDVTESLLNANEGLTSQLQLKDDRIAALEAEGADKDQTIGDLNDKVNELNTKITALEIEQTRLQGVIDQLRISLGDAQKRITELDPQVESLGNQVAKLTKDVEDLTAQLDDAKKQIATLWCHVDRLTTQRGPFYNQLKLALGNDERIQIRGDTLYAPLDVLFDVGSAALKLEGRERIEAAAKIVLAAEFDGDPDWVLQVNGHTDIQQYRSTTRFPKNNWELSVARSLSVVMLLQDNGVPGMRLAAAGYSEYRPVDPEKTQKAYSVNRRVEFKLVEYSKRPGKDCDMPLPTPPTE